jgi:hypothetical protein
MTSSAAEAETNVSHGSTKQHPLANAFVGVIGTGLGAAAAIGAAPIVVPVALAGGVAAYFLTNRIPNK